MFLLFFKIISEQLEIALCFFNFDCVIDWHLHILNVVLQINVNLSQLKCPMVLLQGLLHLFVHRSNQIPLFPQAFFNFSHFFTQRLQSTASFTCIFRWKSASPASIFSISSGTLLPSAFLGRSRLLILLVMFLSLLGLLCLNIISCIL